MTPTTCNAGDVVRGCLSVSQTNGFGCQLVLAVYVDDELKQISCRTLDLAHDGVYELSIETDELVIEKDGSLAKLIIVNNFEDLTPYDY